MLFRVHDMPHGQSQISAQTDHREGLPNEFCQVVQVHYQAVQSGDAEHDTIYPTPLPLASCWAE